MVLKRGVLELAKVVQAGDVAHKAHVKALGSREDRLAGLVGTGQVGTDDLIVHAVLLVELLALLLEKLLAAAHHHEVHTALGELLAERLAHALGGTKDDAPLAVLLA